MTAPGRQRTSKRRHPSRKQHSLVYYYTYSCTIFLFLLLFRVQSIHAQAPLTPQRCALFLAATDLNRDNSLNQEPEWARFVTIVSGSQYATYAAVPAAFQALYDKYAAGTANGEINVAGARTAPPESVTAMCTEVIATLAAAAVPPAVAGTIPPAVVATPPPLVVATTPPATVATTPPAAPSIPALPFPTCRISMAVGDTNRDKVMTADEYVGFLNRLTRNRYLNVAFANLPVALQTNFNALAAMVLPAGTFSVVGSLPADFVTATPEQAAFLQKVCDDTQAITAGPASVATVPPAAATVPPAGVATLPPAAGTLPPAAAATPPPGVTLIPFIQCRARMFVADANRDSLLNNEEYATFADRLVPTESYPTFASLPAPLQANFDALAVAPPGVGGQISINGVTPAQAADVAQLAFLERVCTDTQVAAAVSAAGGGGVATILPTPVATVAGTPVPAVAPTTLAPVVAPPTYSPQGLSACGDMLRISDNNGDERIDQTEYVALVYQLSNNQLFANLAYNLLPEQIKANFVALSDDGGLSLNVQGGTIGANGMNEAQIIQALEICGDTTEAINAYITASATPPPTAPPQVATPLPTCKAHMNTADIDQNSQLTEDQYVIFVNAMAGTPLGPGGASVVTFAGLPQNLQTNFRSLATPNDGAFVGIAGTKPAPPATPEQNIVLQTICTLTDNEVYQVFYGSLAETQAPVVAPTPPPSPRPTTATATCKTDMIAADTNLDKFLSPPEYVTFVNRLSANAFAGVIFTGLHPVLIETFQELAAADFSADGRVHSTEAIDVFGAKPLDTLAASEVQRQHLTTVCLEVTYAIQDALRPPTLAPTDAPSVSIAPSVPPPPSQAPTAFGGETTIYSSFIIYNRSGITAETLDNPQNQDRRQLQLAYIILVNGIVEGNPYPPPPSPAAAAAAAAATPGRGRQLSFLRRRALLALQSGSATILDIEARECPPELIADPLAETCQTVYAWYKLDAVLGGTQDAVYNYYVDLTQKAIQDGELQKIYVTQSGNPTLEVWGAIDPVVKWTAPPTPAPTRIINTGDDDEGINRTVLFVSLVGLVSLIALVVYFAWNDKDKIRDRWREFKKERAKVDKPKDENDDGGSQGEIEGNGEVQYEIGEDGEIIYPEGYEPGYEEVELEEYEDEFDVEQAGGKKKKVRPKKLLGKLGKGVVQVGKHARAFVNELDMDMEEMEAIGFQDENLLDFEDYVFDTPAELLAEQNAANKLAEEAGGGKESARDDDLKASLSFGQSSFTAGRMPNAMTDSTASSASSASGSGSGMDDSDFTEEDFDDEFDSLDSEDDDEDDDSFGLEFSESGGGEGDEDSISTKDDNFGDEAIKDDDSLSSTEDQAALFGGDDVEGMLAKARRNSGSGDGKGGGDDSKSNSDDDENDSNSDSENSSWGSDTTTSSAEQRLDEYRKEVKELVSKVIPEELDNLSTMMDQFEGREAELINTLQNMEERTSTQRARAAVHKTKVRVKPNQVGGYSIASEGSAVIAAASTLGPEPQRRQPRVQQDFYDDDYDSQEGSYYSEDYDSQEGSYYSEDYDSQEGSYYSEDYDSQEEGSYYSGEDEEGSYTEGEGSYTDEEGSYYDDDIPEGDEESYYSGDEEDSYTEEGEEGSFTEGEEGSYDDEIPEGEEESYYSGDEEEGSFTEGEGSYTEEEGEEGSFTEGEEGSYDDDGPEGEEESYYSGEEEGSFSQEDEGSFSQEDEGSFSGSGSYED